MGALCIRRVETGFLDLPALEGLVDASSAEGLDFVARLRDEWESGENRFDRAGEALFEARDGTHLVGVCGLNQDPYLPGADVGRVRHLYVLPAARRHGVGGRLVNAVLGAAALDLDGRGFRRVRLRTNSQAAGLFYLAIGFVATSGEADATHVYVSGGAAERTS